MVNVSLTDCVRYRHNSCPFESLVEKKHKRHNKALTYLHTYYIYFLLHKTAYTVESRLSELIGKHTIRSDNRGVQIDEGTKNSPSMGYQVGDN